MRRQTEYHIVWYFRELQHGVIKNRNSFAKSIHAIMKEETLVTQAYVCNTKGKDLVLQDITLPPMKATDVELDISHCGLCHTDIHMRDNDWGVSDYPLVLGHEGVGVVRKIGDSV